ACPGAPEQWWLCRSPSSQRPSPARSHWRDHDADQTSVLRSLPIGLLSIITRPEPQSRQRRQSSSVVVVCPLCREHEVSIIELRLHGYLVPSLILRAFSTKQEWYREKKKAM